MKPATNETGEVARPDQWNLPSIIFTVRHQYNRDHHNTTFFPSAEHEHNDGKFTPCIELKLRHSDGVVETLLATTEGVIRDPDVHWDGRKIVFSMRKDMNDSYHIYEMDVNDKSVKQLTFAKDVDDLFPFYLADDHIGFSSTCEPKYCGCNRHIMANLYRMEPDGANIYQN
jgi:tricorn protease-like protein